MNNKYKILLVEDEKNIRNLICALLEAGGYQVIQAETCDEGVRLYASFVPDLVILDLGLPDRDGQALIRQVRSRELTPIIVLSARSEESDKVEALDLGANDYVTKPFGSGELMARVRSALRMGCHSAGELGVLNGEFRCRELAIRYDSRRVFVAEREIRLTQTEYNIVAVLARHAGKVLTYSAIIKAVWGYPDEGSVKKLQVNMANIRRKLGDAPGSSNYITNELGVGYRMNTDEE